MGKKKKDEFPVEQVARASKATVDAALEAAEGNEKLLQVTRDGGMIVWNNEKQARERKRGK